MNKFFLRTFYNFFLSSMMIVLAASFFSCSNSNQISDGFDESETLRFTAEKLYSTTSWTEQIESDRLTTPVSAVKGISSKLNLSPLIVAASVPEENSAIFPRLQNFGSLDTTLIPSALRTSLNSFCDAISKNNDSAAEGFFKRENLYSLGLFYVDFRRIFNKALKIEEYEKKVEEWQKEQSEKKAKSTGNNEEIKSDNSTDDSKTESNKPEIVFFDDYMFGEPFLDGIYYEVPVLFTGKKANLTLALFCFEDSGAWKIDQVQISDWEIF